MNPVVFDFAGMIREIDAHQRRVAGSIATLLVVVAALMGLLILAVEQFGLDLEQPGEWTFKRMIVMTAWFGGMLITLIVFCWRAPKAPQFACPLCDGPFTSRYDQMTVLSTGYCPKCTQPLFGKDDASKGSIKCDSKLVLMPAQASEPTVDRGPYSTVISSLIGLVLIVACSMAATTWDESLLVSNPAYPFPIYRLSVALIGGGVLVSHITLRLLARRRERYLCKCTECGEAVEEDAITSITGNCRNCGSRVLNDRLPVPFRPRAQGLWTRSWYRTHGRRWQKWGWISCIAGAIPALSWMAFLYWFCPPSNPHRVTGVLVALWSFALVLQGVSTYVGQNWLRRALGVNCPECHEQLADVPQFVLPSRNCPFCQTTILTDS